MVRRYFVFVHRWAGLAMTLFLVIVGLTGSALAFREELDVWLNPELLTVAKRDAPLLDGFTLREKAAALYPDASFDAVQLHIEPDRSVPFMHMPGMTRYGQYDGENGRVLSRSIHRREARRA